MQPRAIQIDARRLRSRPIRSAAMAETFFLDDDADRPAASSGKAPRLAASLVKRLAL